VVAVGHRRHEPFVLADDELLVRSSERAAKMPVSAEPGFVKR
jgi:hypothetical protein